ncbi:MAG TPA: DUF3667 domain-containing protein [Flavisolibacter sp.]
MSHQPERKEKNCLNCGTSVAGRFCQHCGQENIVNKQSVWGLIRHFIYDIFHFDGKFFDTLRYLLFKPGYIPQQYVLGRRQSYLDPIRMYLFTSAVFFLIYFAINSSVNVRENDESRLMTRTERFEYASALYPGSLSDSTKARQVQYLLDTSYNIILTAPGQNSHPDSTFYFDKESKKMKMVVKTRSGLKVGVNVEGMGWLERIIEKFFRERAVKYGDDSISMLNDMRKIFFKMLPYMLFISLPFFAMILKLLFIRRKQFYFSDHAVFTLYHYIFSFILLLTVFFIRWLEDKVGGWLFSALETLVILWGGVYLLLAMKRFYKQGWGKTLFKFILLNILAFIMIIVLIVIFFFLSAIQL